MNLTNKLYQKSSNLFKKAKRKTLPYVLAGAMAFIPACSGGGGSSSDSKKGVIGPEGGVVEITDPNSYIYGAKITVPKGALDEQVMFTITTANEEAPVPEDFSAGYYINFEADKTEFNKPVECAIPYLDSDNDGIVDGTNTNETDLSVYTYSNKSKSWDNVPITNQDISKNLLFIETNHLSQYTPSKYNDSNYVWPVYINDNAFVYDEVPDYENDCEEGSLCYKALFKYYSTAICNALSALGPVGIPCSIAMAIPLIGDGGTIINETKVSLLFDSDQLVTEEDTYSDIKKNDFTDLYSSLAYPVIQMQTNCSEEDFNKIDVLMYGCDNQVCESLYQQEVLTKDEMSTYNPRLVVVKNPIDFCLFRNQLNSDSFFQVTAPPPASDECTTPYVNDVTIQKLGLEDLCEPEALPDLIISKVFPAYWYSPAPDNIHLLWVGAEISVSNIGNTSINYNPLSNPIYIKGEFLFEDNTIEPADGWMSRSDPSVNYELKPGQEYTFFISGQYYYPIEHPLPTKLLWVKVDSEQTVEEIREDNNYGEYDVPFIYINE